MDALHIVSFTESTHKLSENSLFYKTVVGKVTKAVQEMKNNNVSTSGAGKWSAVNCSEPAADNRSHTSFVTEVEDNRFRLETARSHVNEVFHVFPVVVSSRRWTKNPTECIPGRSGLFLA